MEREERWSELMVLSQQGDTVAYNQLLVELVTVVESFLRKRLGASSKVEDITQEVLLSVHAARHTFQPGKRFSPWFFTIVRRRYIDHLRKLSRNAEDYLLEEEIDRHCTDTNGQDEVAAIFDLRDTLKRLPERQREVFTLVKIQGFSVKEVSEKTGMSEAAVKVSTHRAKKALRKVLSR